MGCFTITYGYDYISPCNMERWFIGIRYLELLSMSESYFFSEFNFLLFFFFPPSTYFVSSDTTSEAI